MFLIVCAILLMFPNEAAIGAKEGLEVAFGTVVVSILPFAVFSSAVISSSAAVKLGKILQPIFSFMNISPYGSIALIAGLLGGYPAGGKIACELYEQKLIDKDEAEEILGYANNGGIIFAVNVCGRGIFQSSLTGYVIFISGVIAACMTGNILSGKRREANWVVNNKKPSFSTVLGKSIASGGNVLVNITASFIVFYALIEALGVERFPFLCGLCEMTKGVMCAREAGSISLAALFFAFGGLNVFAQTAVICEKYDLRLKKYFVGKAMTGVFAFIIAYCVEHATAGKIDAAIFSFFVIVTTWIGMKVITKKLYASA